MRAIRLDRAFRAAIALVFLLAVYVPGTVSAAVPPVMRDGVLEIGAQRVALPPGPWTLLADGETRAMGLGGAITLRSVVLVRLEGGRATAVVVARGNLAPLGGGFGIDPDCRRADLYLARLETAVTSELALCGFVGPVRHGIGDGADPAWRVAAERLQANGAVVPATWLTVGARAVDRDDILDVRYLLDPSVLGVLEPPDYAPPEPGRLASLWRALLDFVGLAQEQAATAKWRSSGWGAEAIAGDPVRTWIVAHVAEWHMEVQDALRRGFKGRESHLDWPRPWGTAFGVSPHQAREFRGGVSGGVADSSWEPLWKTLSWRAVATVLDFLGGLGTGGGLTLAGSALNALAYFAHEYLWGEMGGKSSPGRLTTTLPEVGIAR